MTFDKINRRTHLYGALLLLPWVLMYGASSWPFSHPTRSRPEWTLRMDKEFSLPPINRGDDLDAVADQMVREAGFSGHYGAYQGPDGNVQVYRAHFTGPSRIVYFVEKHRLVVEDQKIKLNSFLTGMHTRGGFGRGGPLDWAWGVLVDVACIGMMVFIASGIYMWWHLKGLRGWGWLALGGGLASFTVFLLGL